MNPEMTLHPTTLNQESRWRYVARSTHDLPNVFSAVRIWGEVDDDALVAALQRVVERHDALRADFPEVEGWVVQRVAGAMELPVCRYDLEAAGATDPDAEALEITRRELLRPFDIRKGPLVRAFLIRLGPARRVLGLVVDHIIVDGWSMMVLWDDLWTCFRTLREGREPDFRGPVGQLSEYAARQRAQLTEESLAPVREYWSRALADLPPPIAWRHAPERPAHFSCTSGLVTRTLPEALADQLTALAGREQSTLFMVLHTALNLQIFRWSGQRDFLVKTMTANRLSARFQRTIGCLAGTIMLRARLPPRQTFRDLLRAHRATAFEAFAHADVPTQVLLDLVGPPVDSRFALRAQICHLHTSIRLRLPEIDGLRVSQLRKQEVIGDRAWWSYDLALCSAETADGLLLEFWYNIDLFGPAIERFVSEFEACLVELTESGSYVYDVVS